MARIAGVDIPNDKQIAVSLTYIYGIGRTQAQKILAQTNVDPTARVRDLTDEEINLVAKELKPLVVSDLILFAYWEKEPVGFSVSLPDYNEDLRHLNGKIGLLGALKFLYYSKKIHKIRVMLLGIKHAFQKKGIEGLLYIETFKRGTRKGYHRAECSWILEENVLMQHGIEAMGGKRYKTYRVYEAPL